MKNKFLFTKPVRKKGKFIGHETILKKKPYKPKKPNTHYSQCKMVYSCFNLQNITDASQLVNTFQNLAQEHNVELNQLSIVWSTVRDEYGYCLDNEFEGFEVYAERKVKKEKAALDKEMTKYNKALAKYNLDMAEWEKAKEEYDSLAEEYDLFSKKLQKEKLEKKLKKLEKEIEAS